MTSPDGISWTLRTAYKEGWDQICYGDGLFVCVNDTNPTMRVMTSPDGINWTMRNSPQNGWQGLCYGNGMFVAVGYLNSGNRVMTSGTLACYLKGSKILCVINEKEQYAPIEQITKDTLVVTYLEGIKQVDLIGSSVITNDPTNEKNSLFKCGDLTVTGMHDILIDNKNKSDRLKHKVRFMEDKICINAKDHPNFEQVKDTNTYTIFHLVLKSDDPNKRYGIYAEGLDYYQNLLQNLTLLVTDLKRNVKPNHQITFSNKFTTFSNWHTISLYDMDIV